jgi:hypothetical protein
VPPAGLVAAIAAGAVLEDFFEPMVQLVSRPMVRQTRVKAEMLK